jgi:hypothetical protein
MDYCWGRNSQGQSSVGIWETIRPKQISDIQQSKARRPKGETQASAASSYLTFKNLRAVRTESMPANGRPARVPRSLELRARVAGELQAAGSPKHGVLMSTLVHRNREMRLADKCTGWVHR